MTPDHEVIIVGAGFGGLGVAIALKREGRDDFLVLEKADDVGGTWRDNTYPGLEVDVPSFTYSYGFELKPDWSQLYAAGPEVKAYADHCADKYEIRPHIRFGAKVVEARFDEEQAHWRVRLAGGDEVTGRYLVNACGYLSDPRLPDIAGIDSFTGKLMHTAAWDHDYDLDGKRVAVIGTGATAIQAAPAIADRLERLDVYQRTAIWLAPKPNIVFSDRAKTWMRRLPIPRIARVCTWFASDAFFRLTFVNQKRYPAVTRWIENALSNYVRKKVDDPVTAEALIPTYSFFCKRPSFSNTFYPMFNKKHIHLVTDPISHVTETGIVTKDGTVREVDAIICATGFHVYDRSSAPMFTIIGEAGKDLGEWWADTRYRAYLGTTVPDFPNLFLMFGPYAAAGSGYHDIVGSQIAHFRRVLRAAEKRGANYVALEREAFDAEFGKIDRSAPRTVLFAGNCASANTYYIDARGDTGAAPRPGWATAHWLKVRLLPVHEYRYERRVPSGGIQESRVATSRATD